MIKRAPRPQKNFLLIRNEVVEDENLSYRARGVLISMLAKPDNWEFNRDWLAKHSGGEGVSAVRKALQEIEAAGYMTRRRIKLPNGKFGWSQTVYDVPQDVSAGQTIGGFSTDGIPADAIQPSKELLKPTTQEQDEVECPHSGRFAPFVGASQIEDQSSSGDDVPASVPAPREPVDEDPPANWHDEDRALFREVVGDRLRSIGGKWNKGEWRTNDFYKAYRTRDGKRLKWPGRYLKQIEERHDGLGVEDWMADQGLERVE